MKLLVLTGNDPRKTIKSGGVRTYNLNLIKIAERLNYDIKFYETRKISKLLKLNKIIYNDYDVILINFSVYDKGFIKLIYELIRIKDKKVIVQCHGGSFNTLRFVKLYNLLFKKIMYKKTHLFLVLNDSQEESLKKNFKVSNDKIQKVPNFIENSFDIKKKNYNEKVKFFYIGRITEDKGIFDFIEAFTEIKNCDIQFNVVGSGPDENKLIRLVKKENRIIYHGKKFGKEKEKLLAESNIFVFLTKHPEGFPIAILEALNYGFAIISSTFPNSEKLVIDNHNGKVINIVKKEIKEQIQYFIKNREFIKIYGENSKKILENNFTLEKQGIDMYKNIFEK